MNIVAGIVVVIVAIAFARLLAELNARQAALEAEEALLMALMDTLNEGVITVNERLQVVRINEKARQLLNLGVPAPFSADLLPEDSGLRNALSAVLSGKIAEPREVYVDGRTLSLTARSLPESSAVLALYDLTPFRRLEAVRRDFVANVSHELRTPLTIMRGVVETLRDDALTSDERGRFLSMTDSNVQRMQRIVDDLLDLSRIESGGWLPKPVSIDVQAVATEALSSLQDAARAKGVQLLTVVSQGAERVDADPTAVRQVVSNLAENALRHTTAGAVTVIASSGTGGVWLGVRDTGAGIAAEHLPRIFERFYRADPGRSRDAGGTGLGLAIVRHLAEAHGGRVRASSSPGTGTVIEAFFPDQPKK